MLQLINDVFWLSISNYLKVNPKDVKGIVMNAHNDIMSNCNFSDYSNEILKAVAVYDRNKTALDLAEKQESNLNSIQS